MLPFTLSVKVLNSNDDKPTSLYVVSFHRSEEISCFSAVFLGFINYCVFSFYLHSSK